jgi:hypothetical protein
MKHVIGEMWKMLQDSGAVIISVSVGIIGKISYEIYMKRTLSIIQWIAIVLMSIISGYLVSVYCRANEMQDEAQILVPIATLLGEKIFIFLIENYQKIAGSVVNIFVKK